MMKLSMSEKPSPYRRFLVRGEAVSYLVGVRQVASRLASSGPKF